MSCRVAEKEGRSDRHTLTIRRKPATAFRQNADFPLGRGRRIRAESVSPASPSFLAIRGFYSLSLSSSAFSGTFAPEYGILKMAHCLACGDLGRPGGSSRLFGSLANRRHVTKLEGRLVVRNGVIVAFVTALVLIVTGSRSVASRGSASQDVEVSAEIWPVDQGETLAQASSESATSSVAGSGDDEILTCNIGAASSPDDELRLTWSIIGPDGFIDGGEDWATGSGMFQHQVTIPNAPDGDYSCTNETWVFPEWSQGGYLGGLKIGQLNRKKYSYAGAYEYKGKENGADYWTPYACDHLCMYPKIYDFRTDPLHRFLTEYGKEVHYRVLPGLELHKCYWQTRQQTTMSYDCWFSHATVAGMQDSGGASRQRCSGDHVGPTFRTLPSFSRKQPSSSGHRSTQ